MRYQLDNLQDAFTFLSRLQTRCRMAIRPVKTELITERKIIVTIHHTDVKRADEIYAGLQE